MESFLIWERIIIESLARKSKTKLELQVDTSINKNLLPKILDDLLQKKIIVQKDEIYNLTQNSLRTEVKEEIKDIFSTLVNNYYTRNDKSVLKLKKCYFTTEELQIFQAYLYSIEALIENVQKERSFRPVQNKLCEQKVILWAYSDYSHLLT